MSVPRNVTTAVVEHELPPLLAYAGRHGWVVTWSPDSLTLLAVGRHPADDSATFMHADVTGYRGVPPAWTFSAGSEDAAKVAPFPSAGALPGGIGSIFHSNRLICAPFNRLAYQDHGGPHGDWGGPASWLNVRGGHARATELADMFALIISHLRHSPGWQQ